MYIHVISKSNYFELRKHSKMPIDPAISVKIKPIYCGIIRSQERYERQQPSP